MRLQENIVRVETKTKEHVSIHVEVAVQYEVIPERVMDAFYRLSDTSNQISAYVFNTVRHNVPKLLLDDVFKSKNDIAKSVSDELTKAMNDFGLRIVHTLITDITPNARVKDSMNEINAAVRSRAAAAEKAEAEKIILVKQAEAEAEGRYLSGKGIADQRLELSKGLRETLSSTLENHGIHSRDMIELMLITQYQGVMRDIAAGAKTKTVFVDNGPGALGDLTGQIRTGLLHARAANLA